MRFLFLSLALIATPVFALGERLQCVPFARAVSGVEIRGDAHTWWDQAAGHYDRGIRPKIGAVLAFKPFGSMRLGHVAAVRKIIDDRNILVSHANWSLIEGTRGHIENNVRVVDVSAAGDWSEVRVWFDALGDLGTTHWPVHGFIYPDKVRGERDVKLAVAALTDDKNGWQQAATPRPIPARPSPARSKPTRVAIASQPVGKIFGFSNGFMADIDRTADRETKPSRQTAKPAQINSIEALLAKIGK